MDHRSLAAISLTGTCLDVLGGLYLAYDLLGGQHGPLRLLTRIVTYSLVFGIGYALFMGPLFGLIFVVAFGVTIALELNRESKGGHYPLHIAALMSATRALAVGTAIAPQVGFRFGMTFAVLSAAGQVLAYSLGARPGMDYRSERVARFTALQARWALARTAGFVVAAMICSAVVGGVTHPWEFAVKLGVVTGVVSSFGSMINPYIEYYADNLPERRLGVFGICLVFCGFSLQSVQYVLVLLNTPIS